MGSCISSPSNPVIRSVSSKKKKRKRRLRLRIRRKSRTEEDSLVRKPEEKLYLKSLIDEDAAYAYNFRKSVASKQLFVIEDAIEDDIHERYVFGNELGRGEFGITYPICDKTSNERFACKIIRKSKLKTETDIEDVRREVEIMRQLPKHPNIVRLREVYENKNAVFLVMELCEGGELFDRIVKRGHYTERAAALVTKSIVEIVKVCHQHGVIHRDLKPENFLFEDENENSQLKAIDFGLSIFFEPGQRFSEIVGSPYYMAPEVLRRNYGPEIDVWSAGIILYILLCGVPPFWAETEEGIAHAIVRSEINFERDPWSKVSEDAKDLVKSMLDPNPYCRLTVEEVLEHPWIQNANEVSDVSLGENVRTRIRHFSLVNKFKKRVLEYVADHLPLSTEKIHKIKEIVDKMDTDKNGNLTFQEELRGNNHHSIGQVVPDPDVKRYLEAAEGHCTRNHEESMIMSVCLKRINSDKHLKHAFFYFDKDKNGYIEFEELREALRESNPQVIQDIIFDVDLDEDGRISYDEFKQMMKSGMDWKMASRQYSRAMLTAVSFKLFKD